MDVSINSKRGSIPALSEIPKEASSGLWSTIKSIFLRIRSAFFSFGDMMSEWMAGFKRFCSGKKHVSEEDSSQQHRADKKDYQQKQPIVDNSGDTDSSRNPDVVIIKKTDLQNKIEGAFPQQPIVDNSNVDNSGNTDSSRNPAAVIINKTDLQDKTEGAFPQQPIVYNSNVDNSGDTDSSRNPAAVNKTDLQDKTEEATQTPKNTVRLMEHATDLPTSLYGSNREVEMEESITLMSVEDIIAHWDPTSVKVDAMIEKLIYMQNTTKTSDPKARMFEIDFMNDGIEHDDNIKDILDVAIVTLKRSVYGINMDLMSYKNGYKTEASFTDEKKKAMQRKMKETETTIDLFEKAFAAREVKDIAKAICYEVPLLGNLLYTNVHGIQPWISSTDKKSAIKKVRVHEDLSDNIRKLVSAIRYLERRVNPSDVARAEKEIDDPDLCSKCKELFEIASMHESNRFTLSTSDQEEDFLKAFHKRYTGWPNINTEKGSRLLFSRILIDTQCLNLKNHTDINICRYYAEGLDEAKRLFYQDRSEERALQAAVALLDEVFDIQPKPRKM